MELSDFTIQTERTAFFTFTSTKGARMKLIAIRGSRMYAGKDEPFRYWQCEITSENFDLKRNFVSSHDTDGAEEGQMYLTGDNPVFFCETSAGVSVAIRIPNDIAALANDFIHSDF